MLEDIVRQTAIKFCRESKIWEEQLNDIYPVLGLNRYQADLPEETEVISLASAIQGKSDIDAGIEHWPSINVFGLLYFEEVPLPDSGPITIRTILRPSDTSTGLPDRIGLDYDTALIHGAIADLQVMPNKDWSAPNLVAFHQNIYRTRRSEACVCRATGNTEQPLRVTPQPFI